MRTGGGLGAVRAGGELGAVGAGDDVLALGQTTGKSWEGPRGPNAPSEAEGKLGLLGGGVC